MNPTHDHSKDSFKDLDFNAIKLKLASPAKIDEWSHGEVLRPETINYRTQKPEKDGLFCERIFGPTKDWECYCGKYKKIRYKGIVCDKCGVEVTRSIVRRERMGHIQLAAPVAHIWFLRGVPSKVGLILDVSLQNLEKIVYFASFIITFVNEDLKQQSIDQLESEYKGKKKQIEEQSNRLINQERSQINQNTELSDEQKAIAIEKKIEEISKQKDQQLKDLHERVKLEEEELKNIKPMRIISETAYHEMSFKYGHIFEAGIGAEAVSKLLEKVDLDALEKEVDEQVVDATGVKKEKLIKRAKLIKSFKVNGIRPEWMILSMVPVIPPDLRPMVPLDGGRFATSDLNDLYRRVINRNNRLKQLIELKAPEVICRNEKRMLQEAVDALIDNSARHGKTVVASTGQKRMLKSLADMLKGKRGRFRQNLLGKRIDYSGRSVIVVGPKLKLYQCGLPKTMALELFKPFVISQLIRREFVYNVRSASRFIESGRDEVWDILEEIIDKSHVLLNRAPTLHRLGIQAFKPVLIEGKAIQVHPLVCPAFNADFDGDQMAVHVPLSEEAQKEAGEIMLASHNLLKPATGQPIVTPNQDIIWGSYYMTSMTPEESNRQDGIKHFSDKQEVFLAHSLGRIQLQEKIKMLPDEPLQKRAGLENGQFLETTVGRIYFDEIVPKELKFYNTALNKKVLGELVSKCLDICGPSATAKFLDDIKEIAFKYLTLSGYSWGIADIPTLSGKASIIEEAESTINTIQEQYEMGFLTFDERRSRIISCWVDAKDKITKISTDSFSVHGALFSIIDSAARGNWGQLIQIVGMRGLVANPAGDIIELAIKSNFKEGLDVLEYFISTHGSRKGLADTALRTASSGYLTRRLVDVSQDIIVYEDDCGDDEGTIITAAESERSGVNLSERIMGRTTMEDIIDPKTKEVITKKGEIIDKKAVDKIHHIELDHVHLRSVLTCKSIHGVCKKCYGWDLAYNQVAKEGTAVGIIAAQSIGEPGTQLTMRTFHTGGVAGSDITQGLPRVEELFECRPPKVKAVISEVSGKVSISAKQKTVVGEKGQTVMKSNKDQKIIAISYMDNEEDSYRFAKKEKDNKSEILVKDGQKVKADQVLFKTKDGVEIKAKRGGEVKIDKTIIKVFVQSEKEKEYIVPSNTTILVNDGDLIGVGDQLTEGSVDLQQLFLYKGKVETQKYIINEIQNIYGSQGQKLNDKHVELIVKQMFSRVYVVDIGDTELLPGEIIEKTEFLEANIAAAAKNGQPATARELLMGITKASLSTKSWLSAASFQETARVLINAAVSGKIDKLEGLKENVIIGRLIPCGTGYRHKEQ